MANCYYKLLSLEYYNTFCQTLMLSKVYKAQVYCISYESEFPIYPFRAALSAFLSVVKNPLGLILPSWTGLFIV